MFSRELFYLVTFSYVLATAHAETEKRVAVAHLSSSTISGSIVFTEVEDGIRVTGTITGLNAGDYGFHVHELGDISTCDATGAHFNLDATNHGGRDHAVRHTGDLGNVRFTGEQNAVATIDFVDKVITLRGRNNILGRGLVLHEQEDDLGQGGHETSLTTGNAGARVACGVIGIRSPAGYWSSATISGPSVVLLLIASVMCFFKH